MIFNYILLLCFEKDLSKNCLLYIHACTLSVYSSFFRSRNIRFLRQFFNSYIVILRDRAIKDGTIQEVQHIIQTNDTSFEGPNIWLCNFQQVIQLLQMPKHIFPYKLSCIQDMLMMTVLPFSQHNFRKSQEFLDFQMVYV